MEQSDKNSVEVVIGGEVVTLVGEESEEHFQKIARYIDKKISQIGRTKTFAGNSFMKTLLIAVNIADDLFKELDKNQELSKKTKHLEEELEQYIEEFGKVQNENLVLSDKLSQLQMELDQARIELEEYIEAFDAKTRQEKPSASEETLNSKNNGKKNSRGAEIEGTK